MKAANKIYQLFILIIVSCVMSCKQSSLSKEAYASYIDSEKSELVQSKEIGNFTVQCEYKTPEYIALRESNKDGEQVNQTKINEYKNTLHFYLKFSSTNQTDFLKEGIENAEEYGHRLAYFTEHIQNNISVVLDNDTIPCSYSYFERNYGVQKGSTLLVGFDKINSELETIPNMSFIYDDQVLGIGPIIFRYKSQNLKNIPQLDI
jgi:hypothetical protein